MSLFRINPNNTFNGPHQGISALEHGTPLAEAKAAIVMVHGRGAGARSMLPLADEFNHPDFHFVIPKAQNSTWYPYSFLRPTGQNEPGISSGLQVLYNSLQMVNRSGIPYQNIMLLGFSQGACLATEFAARHPQKLGGVVAFSGGLIGPEVDEVNYTGSMEQTPVFLGCSNIDPHIPVERVSKTEAVFNKLNANVNKQIYKGMGHTVNRDEMETVRMMMKELIHN